VRHEDRDRRRRDADPDGAALAGADALHHRHRLGRVVEQCPRAQQEL
jgi:hypothetical protein